MMEPRPTRSPFQLPLILIAVLSGLLWLLTGAVSWQGYPVDAMRGAGWAAMLAFAAAGVVVLVALTAGGTRVPGAWETTTALLALAACRLTMTSLFPLGGDEAYHWQWSRRLDFSYYDHPGMTAWLARLMSPGDGRSNAAVRLSPWLMTSALPFLAWRLARETGNSGEISRRAALFTSILPIVAGGILLMPMTAIGFFWVASLIFLWRSLLYGRVRDGALLGLSFGGAINCNFTAVLFPLFAAGYLLWQRSLGSVLRRRWFHVATGVFASALIPIAYWNVEHDWATFGFNLMRRHREISFHPTSLLSYLLQFAGYFSPLAAIAVGAALWKCRRGDGNIGSKEVALTPAPVMQEPLRPTGFHNDSRRYLVVMSIGPLLFFGFTSLFLKPRAHYAVTAFVPLVILLTHACMASRRGGLLSRSMFMHSTRVSAGIVAAVFIGMIAPAWVPTESAANLLHRLSPRRTSKTVAQVYGWSALGTWIDGLGLRFTREGPDVILAASYSQASTMLHHARSAEFVYSRDEGRIPYGQQFGLWGSIQRLPPGTNALVIYAGTADDGSIAKKDWKKYFRRVNPVDTGASGLDPRLQYFTILRCESYLGGLNRIEKKPTDSGPAG